MVKKVYKLFLITKFKTVIPHEMFRFFLKTEKGRAAKYTPSSILMMRSAKIVILSGARQRAVEGSRLGRTGEPSASVFLLCQDPSTPLRSAQDDTIFLLHSTK